MVDDTQDKLVKYTGRATAHNIEFGIADATCTALNKRIHIKGKFSLALVMNAIKFKDQIQLQVYSENVTIEDRAKINNQKWNRIEIYLDLPKARELIEALKKLMEEAESTGDEV